MLSERLIELTDRALRVASGPASGPPMLLLHGVVRRWQDFAPLIPAIVPRWQVHALDFRGHGGSDRMPGRYHVIDYVDDALTILRMLPEPAIVYGHSLGALVAAATAAKSPDRVRAVVLEDPPSAQLLRSIHATPYFALFTSMQALAGETRSTAELTHALGEICLPSPGGKTVRLRDVRDATDLRFVASCLKHVDRAVFEPLIAGRWLDGYDVESIMHGVKCPAIILRGDEAYGGMLNRPEAEEWTAMMADATLIDVPGVGHLIHWLATGTTLRMLLGFLESLR